MSLNEDQLTTNHAVVFTLKHSIYQDSVSTDLCQDQIVTYLIKKPANSIDGIAILSARLSARLFIPWQHLKYFLVLNFLIENGGY